jgi:hypothetical protein
MAQNNPGAPAFETTRPLSSKYRSSFQLACLFVALGCALLAGCGQSAQERSAPARQMTKSELSVAEQKFGVAPVPDSSVTYQPDVIGVGGGAEAIRAQSPNGFIWTIDASAPRARDLVPGKIFFMTGRAVGRVLDVREQGGDLVVTIGPVDITEIVREAHIHIADMPLDFGEALAYTSSELPGQAVASAAPTDNAAALPAMFVRTVGPGSDSSAAPSPVAPVPDVSNLVHFKTTPFASSSGVGVQVRSDGGGLKVSAKALVHLARPTLDVHLDITPTGGITQASVELKGAAGLTWNFDVGTDVGLKANVNGLLQPDTDFSIPVGGIGPLPFAVTVRQRFQIKTGLGVRNSTLGATGDYTFNGGFNVGYIDKKWSVGGPVGFTAKQSMMQTAQGVSIAASGVNLAHQMRVIVGVGAHGFAAGPYFSFTSAVGLFKGSDLGIIPCKEATLVVSLTGGVGYSIPKSVTGLINSVLRALNIKYQIVGEGGLEPSEPLTIVNSTSTLKGCQAGSA